MSICVKRKKNLLKIHYSPCGFKEHTAPKQLTNHNARNLSLVETESLSGGLCGRQALPYRHWIYAHYLSISAHLKCVASEDDWYLCKNISMSFALCQKILICIAVVVVVVAVIGVTYLHKWCHVILVWPLPGTIPQFRDNWFKNQGYFTIKQNEINLLSSTIYLKTNKNINTTKIQILHKVYASHYPNQWCENYCKAS